MKLYYYVLLLEMNILNLPYTNGLIGLVRLFFFFQTYHIIYEFLDFGVPASGLGILRLLRHIRNDINSTVLVHCSAGVGRTGTVMVIEIALRAMLDGKEINVLEIVKELR